MQRLAFFLRFFVLFCSAGHALAGKNPLDTARELARANQLASSHTWLSLHYYTKSGNSSWSTEIRSDEKGKKFFLSPGGASDPAAELDEFLRQIFSAQMDGDENIQCRFPARFSFLRRELNLPRLGVIDAKCDRYAAWRGQVDADSASLLFASAFLNSPASMYGHTLLELGRSGKTKEDPLLDYVVAFGAETGGVGGLPYLILGLTGGFPGYFSTVPFYLKIREYNDAESRDLWAYRLKLSKAQMDLLLRHLWEVRTANFPYYFLGKNCSYFLLEFLEVVNTGEPLVSDLPAWTIPVDTIRVLYERGWIESKTYRASRSARMYFRRERLEGAEQGLAGKLADPNNFGAREEWEKLPEARRAFVLDAAYDYLRYREGGRPPTPPELRQETWMLSERSRLKIAPLEMPLNEAEAPESSHASNRVGAGFGIAENSGDHSGFERFEWRPALHDLLTDPLGLDHYGEQAILDTRLRIENRRREVLLDSLDLISIRALSPIDPWVVKPSWRFQFGQSRARDKDCLGWRCTFFRVEGGAGISLPLWAKSENILFAIADLDLHGGAPFSGFYRIGAGPELGIKLNPLKIWRIIGEARPKRYFLGDRAWVRNYSVQQSLALGRGWEFRMQWNRIQSNQDFLASVYLFY